MVQNEKIHVLLVEDNPGDSRLIRELLYEGQPGGFDLTCAGLLEDGLHFLASGTYDIVLLDLDLPDSKGIDSFLKAHANSPKAPIVVLTGLDDEYVAHEAIRKGAQDYLVKGQLDHNLLWRVLNYAIERNKAKETLRKSEEQLSNFMESATDAFTLWDSSLYLLEINQAGLKIFANGAGKSDVLGKNIKQILPGMMDSEKFKRFVDIIEKGEPVEVEEVVPHEDFGNIDLSLKAFKCGDGLGIISRDMTVRKRMERELIQTEKMSAIGTMVAGVAHELNNPLMAIIHFAQYCLKHTDHEDKKRPVLHDIEIETKRCIDIVQNLLTFSRKDGIKNGAIQKENLEEVFTRLFKLLSYRLEKENISLIFDIDEETPKIMLNTNGIQQAFFNLITNALDALSDSKKKEIRVDLRRCGAFVIVTIKDSGSGIATENWDKIFDPFFTTKRVGQGTGLGLSLCQSIIESHGGEIAFESKPEWGTEFSVLLPIETEEKSE